MSQVAQDQRRVERNSGEAGGDRIADVVEMWRATADHRAQTDHGVVLDRELLGDDGQFKSTSNADDGGLRYVASVRRGQRTLEQRVDDVEVPAGGDDAQGQAACSDRDRIRSAGAAHNCLPLTTACRS